MKISSKKRANWKTKHLNLREKGKHESAEEIIRTGKIPLPLKVRFAGEYEDIPNWRLHYGGDYSLN